MVVDLTPNISRGEQRRLQRLGQAGPTVSLSFVDRFALLQMLPVEGSVMTIRILRDLKDELGFSEEEVKKSKLKEVPGGVQWDAGMVAKLHKDVPMGEKARDIIRESLEGLEKQKKLKLEFLDLYERFVEGGD